MKKSKKSRAWTKSEVRDKFVDEIRDTVDYWRGEVRGGRTSPSDALSGLAHSVFVLLDGGTDLPGFRVSPCPHVSDKEYHNSKGENWYPDSGDIAGALHELLYRDGWR